jgi:hypothetical protein
MLERDPLASIPDADLEDISGGAPRSSTNTQLQLALQQITDSLGDLKNQNNKGSLDKILPFMVMAKVVRGY